MNMQIGVTGGVIEGIIDARTGVRSYKGIPFAAPPVGDLRWRAPQPVVSWSGVRAAHQFGARAMQLPIFGDMDFRSPTMSEDCLYLNVWAPVDAGSTQLPVLVYFYGGGNVAGDGSEPRYDGAVLAQQGIIAITVNYRLNVFGFFAHPELSKEAHGSSGNYGYLDQLAALQWVRDNIAAFGGDPQRVTIAGESAGSISVSAQMASPLAKDLIAGAIGSSGSLLGALSAIPLAEAEQLGSEIAAAAGVTSLVELRALPAEQVLALTEGRPPQQFTGVIDGVFLPQSPAHIFATGQQAQVPLLVGWNSTEVPYMFVMQQHAPTLANYHMVVQDGFGAMADDILRVYHASTDADVPAVATDLASDLFIGYSTWKWADLHAHTSDYPVYRYVYAHPRPAMRSELGDAVGGLAGGVIRGEEAKTQPRLTVHGAVHSADIEYFMGNLDTNTVYDWHDSDYRVSAFMQQIYLNFVKNGNPSGGMVASWPKVLRDSDASYLWIDTAPRVVIDAHRDRYDVLGRVVIIPE
ncbi:MAG: carboxylesterase/lipase family protein [Roseiflexaceae bacterium]